MLDGEEMNVAFRQAPREAVVRYTHPRSVISVMRSPDLGRSLDVEGLAQLAAGRSSPYYTREAASCRRGSRPLWPWRGCGCPELDCPHARPGYACPLQRGAGTSQNWPARRQCHSALGGNSGRWGSLCRLFGRRRALRRLGSPAAQAALLDNLYTARWYPLTTKEHVLDRPLSLNVSPDGGTLLPYCKLCNA